MTDAAKNHSGKLQEANLERYSKGLQDYLAGGGEDALQDAYELGRSALGDSKSILEILSFHHVALQKFLENSTDSKTAGTVVPRAEAFLAEVLSPYEMTHRGYREAVGTLRHLNEMLEQEIKRIAHAVHDDAGQLLVAVHLAFADLDRDLPPPLHDRAARVKELLDQIDEQLRRLSHELRPTVLDDLGLVPAIKFLADGVSKRSDQAISVRSSLKERLPAPVETALYRIVQEALTNAAKHSHARNVRIQLDCTSAHIRCLIHDDGTGFDVASVMARKASGGLGLLGMQERLSALGGTLQIESSPNLGTSILIHVPVEAKHEDSHSASR